MKSILTSPFAKACLKVAVIAVIATACSDDAVEPVAIHDGEYVDVSIRLESDEMVNITPTSRATTVAADDDIVCEMVPDTLVHRRDAAGINDPDPTSTTAIMNLWVLQYDGTGNDAKLVTSAYIADYTSNKTAKLIASTGENTIVFIANTFDNTIPFPINSTITELKGRRFTTQSLSTIVVKNPNTASIGDVGAETFPNDGDYYQRLNGMIATTIEEGMTISGTLQHNACRISINVTNNTAGTTYPVTLKSADIEHVPGCMYFLTDYTGYTSGNAIGKPTSDDINLYGMHNYADVITWTVEEGTGNSPKNAKLYLPANESGIVTSNENAKLKSLFAPARSTILRLHGTFQDSEINADIPITYTFALGEDMVKNYQLVPNGDYIYNITINARGDKTTDGRVTYGSANGADYTDLITWPLANCYICNPPTTGEAMFKIPVARVDQFWGGGNYENVPNNCLGANNPWIVEVIWSDMPVNDSNFKLTKSAGNGKNDHFEVTIPATSGMGNVIVGIKRSSADEEYLWSWHLWVTDYCPDDAKYLVQQNAFLDGTDTYHVTGGDVQRYSKTTSGVQKVYMDRCIGVIDPTETGSSTRGVMYYQYGRKDPFPGNSPEYYQAGHNKQTYSITKKVYNQTSDKQPQNVPYAVNHPQTFIYNTNDGSRYSYWTYNDIYNPTSALNSIIWQDPYSSEHNNKSIFDPSPSGWKVPANYEGLSFNTFTSNTLYANTNQVPAGRSVIIPAYGKRAANTGNLENTGSCYLYNTKIDGQHRAYYLWGGQTYFYHSTGTWGSSYGRAYAYPIRPVEE